MNVLVILGHPRPGSFNHAIADTVCEAAGKNGHCVRFHDLYAERFDPCLPDAEIPEHGVVPDAIKRHCADLQAADGIVVIHPNWWGQPPAILKGWVDRVIRPGIAYRFLDGDSGEGVPVGLLKARAALVLNTSNTPAAREQEAFGDPLETLWKNCVFGLCGVSAFHRRTFAVVVTSSVQQRREWLQVVAALSDKVFPASASARTPANKPSSSTTAHRPVIPGNVESLPRLDPQALGPTTTKDKGVYVWWYRNDGSCAYVGRGLNRNGLLGRVVRQHLCPTYLKRRPAYTTGVIPFVVHNGRPAIEKSVFRKAVCEAHGCTPGPECVAFIKGHFTVTLIPLPGHSDAAILECERLLIQHLDPRFNKARSRSHCGARYRKGLGQGTGGKRSSEESPL